MPDLTGKACNAPQNFRSAGYFRSSPGIRPLDRGANTDSAATFFSTN